MVHGIAAPRMMMALGWAQAVPTNDPVVIVRMAES